MPVYMIELAIRGSRYPYLREVSAATKRQAIRIARDEYDDEQRPDRGYNARPTPLAHFNAWRIAP